MALRVGTEVVHLVVPRTFCCMSLYMKPRFSALLIWLHASKVWSVDLRVHVACLPVWSTPTAAWALLPSYLLALASVDS